MLRAKEQLQQKCRIKCQHRKIISILYTNDEEQSEKKIQKAISLKILSKILRNNQKRKEMYHLKVLFEENKDTNISNLTMFMNIKMTRVTDELWNEVRDIVQEIGIKTIPKRNAKKKKQNGIVTWS